jgi:molybdenum-dependent DNA-binding transcriptional regulator ModE
MQQPTRNHWTPTRQRAFLKELSETGSVAAAARAAGMSRSSAHRMRARLSGTLFDHSWTAALRMRAERLADLYGFAAPAVPELPDWRVDDADAAPR